MKKLVTLFFLLSSVASFSQNNTDTTKTTSFAAIPVINYDPSTGLTLGAMTQLFYKTNKQDTISPSSSTGLFGMYTTNNSYFFSAFEQLYFKKDTWRILGAIGFGSINYQYWQQIPIIGGSFIGFNTEATFAALRVERKLYKKLYGGINTIYAKAKTQFDVPEAFPDSLRFDERNMNNLGYQFNYDLRDHQINPYEGFNIEFKNSFYRTWLNSGNNFENYELTYNHYHQLKNERNILATRIHASISAGDVPFQGQNIVGRDDIRGYTSGKYRNNQVYAIQAEYRWRFYKKFGMVGFAGIASAVETIGDIGNSELLPGVGVGLRYMMIEKERVNIGFDIATGKDDWGLYFRIGESFAR